MKNTGIQSSYYDAHARLEAEQAAASEMPACFSAPDSVEAWRHRRMYKMLDPLIKASPDSTWITVGDGSYGSDAYYLEQQGVNVLATSLTDSSLKIAKEKGFIQKYAVVNAEQIPYADDVFDFVLCKEAYHHFPRPAIAFYEMLRVAKSAVVLIEPYDGPKRFLDRIKDPMKKLLWGRGETIHFEPCGNYIYRIHPHEIGKKLTALGCSAVVYKKFNDIYLPRSRFVRAGASFGYAVTRLIIFLQNILCTLRLLNQGSVAVIAFKGALPDVLEKNLRRAGYRMDVLPINPYTVNESEG